MTGLNLPIIGYMSSPYKEKFGIPRQPNLVQVESYIEMQAPYNDELAFEGIDEFSHLWLVWQFHDNKNQQEQTAFRPQVRPPRLGGNKKIGVFATRSMYRPVNLCGFMSQAVTCWMERRLLISSRISAIQMRCWMRAVAMRSKNRSASRYFGRAMRSSRSCI